MTVRRCDVEHVDDVEYVEQALRRCA